MDGILVIDKPTSFTSHDIVVKVRKILNFKKVGHTGTLDPIATGVLILCLGKATKLTSFFQRETKEYLGEMTLGITTDSGDSEGKVLAQKPCEVDPKKIKEAFKKFEGEIWQIPPMISAVKLKGRPLYRWARKGKEIERPARKVKIFEFEFQGLKKKTYPVRDKISNGTYPTVSFRVKCSKGTYVRALAEEVGKVLECGAHLSKVIRIRCGSFSLNEALALEKLEEYVKKGRLNKVIFSPAEALKTYPFVKIKENFTPLISKGAPLAAKMLEDQSEVIKKDEVFRVIDSHSNLLGMSQAIINFSRLENSGKVVGKPLCILK